MATTRRCRCWPKTRPLPAGYGPMCGTTGRLPDRTRRRRCSSIRAIATASTPTGISPAMPGSSRPMPMPGSAISTTPSASPDRSPRRRAGATAGATSSSWPISANRRSLSRRSAVSTRSSRSSARSTASRLEQRLAVRQERIKPLVDELEEWMLTERARLSRHADIAKAIDYMLKRWPAFTRFLDDGRICLTTDGVEKSESSARHGFSRLLAPGFDHSLVGPFGPFDVSGLLLADTS